MAVYLEDKLRETHMALILDRLPVGITVIDPEGRMLYYNEYSSQILDRKPEYLGKDVRACHEKSESKTKIDRMLQEFKQGKREEFYYETVRYGNTIGVTFTPLEADGWLFGCVQSVTLKK